MSNTVLEGVEPAKSKLRATIAAMEKEIGSLPKEGGAQGRLQASVVDLVGQLALGPEPEVRVCPVCHHVGMRAATLCSYCWAKLPRL